MLKVIDYLHKRSQEKFQYCIFYVDKLVMKIGYITELSWFKNLDHAENLEKYWIK